MLQVINFNKTTSIRQLNNVDISINVSININIFPDNLETKTVLRVNNKNRTRCKICSKPTKILDNLLSLLLTLKIFHNLSLLLKLSNYPLLLICICLVVTFSETLYDCMTSTVFKWIKILKYCKFSGIIWFITFVHNKNQGYFWKSANNSMK